jgi:RNA polymerase sigma-70 factor (ECF subfamily)
VCDDLVQDVLERLMKQSHTIQKIANESGKLAYYINATVQSTIVDRFRAEGGAASVTVPPDTLDNLDQERISARQLPFEDTYWDIQLLKKKLPAKDWMLLEGKYLIGYSDEELGRLYGCSKNSVRMILTRVKRKAKELLFADGTEGGMSNGR